MLKGGPSRVTLVPESEPDRIRLIHRAAPVPGHLQVRGRSTRLLGSTIRTNRGHVARDVVRLRARLTCGTCAIATASPGRETGSACHRASTLWHSSARRQQVAVIELVRDGADRTCCRAPISSLIPVRQHRGHVAGGDGAAIMWTCQASPAPVQVDDSEDSLHACRDVAQTARPGPAVCGDAHKVPDLGQQPSAGSAIVERFSAL